MRTLLILWLCVASHGNANELLIQAASNQLLAASQVLPEASLVARIQSLADDDGLPGPIRNQILHRFVIALRLLPESAPARAAVQAVARLPALEASPHPESAATVYDPVGLTAAAWGTLNAWQWRYWEQRAHSDLARLSLDFVADPEIRSNPIALRGAAHAIAHSSAKLNIAELRSRVAAEPALAPLAVAAFHSNPSLPLLQFVARHSSPAETGRLVNQLDQLVPPDVAISWWIEVLENPDMAPIAMAGLARQRSPQSLSALAKLLEIEQLAGAAVYGLKAFNEPWARPALQELLQHANPTVRQHARLLAVPLDINP